MTAVLKRRPAGAFRFGAPRVTRAGTHRAAMPGENPEQRFQSAVICHSRERFIGNGLQRAARAVAAPAPRNHRCCGWEFCCAGRRFGGDVVGGAGAAPTTRMQFYWRFRMK